MRSTSGVLYKVIPARPVMGPEVFQAARKSAKEIEEMKGAHIQEYYRNLVSMVFLLVVLFFGVLCSDGGL